MSLNLTPSERAHEELLNIPTRARRDDQKKIRIDIILKNIVGWPIALCLLLVPLVAMAYAPAADFLMFVTSALIMTYILCDLFSNEREWRVYRLGIELFAFLLAFYLCGKYLLTQLPDSSSGIFQQYGWVVWLYALTYGLDLFPGIDRLGFWILVTTILGAAVTLAITLTGQFPVEYFVW